MQTKAARITELEKELAGSRRAAANPVAAASREAAAQLEARKLQPDARKPQPESPAERTQAEAAKERRAARLKHEIHAAAAVAFERALIEITAAASDHLEEQLAEEANAGQVGFRA